MNPFNWIKNQSLFRDQRAVWLGLAGFLFTAYNTLFFLFSIESREFKVPVRYSGYFEGILIDRGDWFSFYVFPLFAVMTFVLNLALAIKIHKMRPELAQVLLGLQLIISWFTLLVAGALLDYL